MGFNQIRDNDLATADVIMDNFTHVNYGNPLLPTDPTGHFIDSQINIGSPTHKFQRAYIDSVTIEQEFQRNYAQEGDIHYTDKEQKDKSLEKGPAGAYLRMDPSGKKPQWDVIPTSNKNFIIETDWEELPYIDIVTSTYNQDKYNLKGAMTPFKKYETRKKELMPKSFTLPEPIDPKKERLEVSFAAYSKSEYDGKTYDVDPNTLQFLGMDYFNPYQYKSKKLWYTGDVDPKETCFGHSPGLLWWLDDDNQTLWWGRSHPLDMPIGYMTVPAKDHDLPYWTGKPWQFLREAAWGGFAKAYVYKYTYKDAKPDIDSMTTPIPDRKEVSANPYKGRLYGSLIGNYYTHLTCQPYVTDKEKGYLWRKRHDFSLVPYEKHPEPYRPGRYFQTPVPEYKMHHRDNEQFKHYPFKYVGSTKVNEYDFEFELYGYFGQWGFTHYDLEELYLDESYYGVTRDDSTFDQNLGYTPQ